VTIKFKVGFGIIHRIQMSTLQKVEGAVDLMDTLEWARFTSIAWTVDEKVLLISSLPYHKILARVFSIADTLLQNH
jgi:hypothetical protein